MRKKIFLVGFAMTVFAILGLVVQVKSAKADSSPCQTRLIAHSISPDGKWDAIAYETYFTGNYFFDSTDATHVAIREMRYP